MYNIVLILLVVTSGIWADPNNGYDLNLEQIFRTPKDFSKANFDHFEILERNNFENQNASPATPTSDNGNSQTTDNPLKSIANAQVMLRIGGDNIRDCNRITIPSCRHSKEQIDHSLYPVPPCGVPFNRPPFLPPIPYPFYPHCIYPYPPPPPYAFPGCYYGPRYHLPYQRSPYTLYNGQLVPAEDFTESPQEETFLEKAAEEATVCVDKDIPKIVEEVTVDNPEENCTEEKTYIVEKVPTERIIKEPCQESSPEIVTLEKIDTTTVNPNPCPHRVAYVEVNLADAKRDCAEASRDIKSLLDQSLVPFTCQKCDSKRKVLVSYPVTKRPLVTIPEEEIEVSGCPCCAKHGVCNCCNRERNASIPFGQRFSKDLDSLLDIVSPITTSTSDFLPGNLYNRSPNEKVVKVWPHFVRKQPVIEEVIETARRPQPCVTKEVVNIPPVYTGVYKRPRHPKSPVKITKHLEDLQPQVQFTNQLIETKPCLPTMVIEPLSPQPQYQALEEIIDIRPNLYPAKELIEITHPLVYFPTPIANTEFLSLTPLAEVPTNIQPCLKEATVPYWNGAPYLPHARKAVIKTPPVIPPAIIQTPYIHQEIVDIVFTPQPQLITEAAANYESVVYQQPPTLERVKHSNPVVPVIKHKAPATHVYKVVPKYDIIPRGDIKPLNIPDLVPTNKYLYTKCPEPVPTMPRPVDRLPLVKNLIFIPGWPFTQDVPVTRAVPLAPGYRERCTTCAKYRGELNELTGRC